MGATSAWNDLVSYLATNPVNVSRSPLNISAATPRLAVSYSPTLHFADLTSEAQRNIWAPKQNEISKEAERGGCSEVGCLNQSVDEHQSNHGRYKTELCRSFEESGFCRYGSRCQFAHGMQELKTVDRHPKYKTQLCKTFHTTGLCRYGTRCHFIHNEDEGAKHQRLSPHQEQQQPLLGLRKLTGRQMPKSMEEQQQPVTSAVLPTSVSFSNTRSAKNLFPGPGMSFPSSTASSPSASPAFFSNDSSSSSAGTEIFSQTSVLRQSPISSYSESFHTTDLFADPSIRPWGADSAYLQPKLSGRDSDRIRKEMVDALLRHMTKAQIELLVEYLVQKEKENMVV